MKKQSMFSRLFAVLMAVMMVCTVVPASSFSFAYAAQTTTSATATRKMSKVKVTYTKSLTYTGKARKPKLTVKYGKTKLKKGTDYTVTYKNNKEIGVAKIIIKAKAGSAYTGSKTLKFKIVPAKVKGVTAKKVTSSAVKLGWNAVKGAKGYIVYRYNSKTQEYTKIKATKKLAMTVKDLAASKTYRFAVRAYAKADKNYYGTYSKTLKVKTAAAPAPVVPTEPTSVIPTQPTVPTQPTEPTVPTQPTQPTVPTVPTQPTQPTEPTSPPPASPPPTEPTVPVEKPAKVTGIQVVISGSDVSFSWAAVPGATGYELAQYDAATKTYQLMSGVVSTNASVKNLTEDKPYQFAVRAYVLNGTERVYGEYSELADVNIASTKPIEAADIAKVINVKAEKKDAVINLSWSAVGGVTGYEIATVNGTSYTKVATSTTNTAALDKLERHKELQLVVRAFVTQNGNPVYGPYSDPVSAIVYNADYYGAAFRSGTFRMSMNMDMGTGTPQDVSFAVKGDNMNISATLPIMDGVEIPTEFRMLNGGKKFYIRLGNGLTATWYDATSMMQEGDDFADLGSMMNMSSMFEEIEFDTSKGVTMSTETKDGVTYEVETITGTGRTTKFYTVNNDLRLIVAQDQYGTQEIAIKNFSPEVSDSLFTAPSNAADLKEMMDMLSLLGGA